MPEMISVHETSPVISVILFFAKLFGYVGRIALNRGGCKLDANKVHRCVKMCQVQLRGSAVLFMCQCGETCEFTIVGGI